MKIKDVITETGLTDRAIRLYIENGLVAPSCSESYAGRKNIDFTQDDVDTLKNIATLRKAGFSIAQIKTIIDDSSTTAEVVRDIISDLSEKVKSNTAVIDSLKTALENENINIDTVCHALNNATADKNLPTEDSKLSDSDKIVRFAMPLFGLVCILLNIPSLVTFFKPELRDWAGYLYPCYDSAAVAILLFPLIPVFLSLHFIFAFNKKNTFNKKSKKFKIILSAVLALALSTSTILSSFFSKVYYFYGEEAFVVSQTSNIDNYMIFDDKKAESALSVFLPEVLPEYKAVYYKYSYKDPKISHEPPRTIVYLELWLNDADYEQFVKQYKTFKPTDSVTEPETQKFADWSIVFYRDEHEYAPSNYTPVFAYNDFYKCVRFICHYGQTSLKGAPRKDNLVSSYDW